MSIDVMRMRGMCLGDMARYAYETACERRDAMAEAGASEEDCDREYDRTYAAIEGAWWQMGDDAYDRHRDRD